MRRFISRVSYQNDSEADGVQSTNCNRGIGRRSSPQGKTWRPKLGIYCQYSPANLEFARQEGFTCVQLAVERNGLSETFTDEQIASSQNEMKRSGLLLSALGAPGNHLDPDPGARARFNAHYVKVLELAGELGVPYVGGSSGAVPGQPFAAADTGNCPAL